MIPISTFIPNTASELQTHMTYLYGHLYLVVPHSEFIVLCTASTAFNECVFLGSLSP